MFGHVPLEKNKQHWTHNMYHSCRRHIIVSLPRTSKKLISTPAILWIWSRWWFCRCRSQRNQACGRWLGFWPIAAPISIWTSRWRCLIRRIWTMWEESLEVHHATRATWASCRPNSAPWWRERIPSSRQSLGCKKRSTWKLNQLVWPDPTWNFPHCFKMS